MKKSTALFFCILLSFGIWLTINLSQPYSVVLSMPVTAVSNLEGCAEQSSDRATVVARCKLSGFNVVRNNRKAKRRGATVRFNSSDFVRCEDMTFAIPASKLYGYVESIFGENVQLEAFISDFAEFRFTAVSFKKVPVHPVQTLSFREQYRPVSEMTTYPDSVLVYAEPGRLENIDMALTRPISRSDLNDDINGVVRLEPLSGVRYSQPEVTYHLSVSRFVQLSSDVPVSVRNVPAGHSLNVFPSRVHLVLNCFFPVNSDPFGDLELYVDYREFASSITGRCVVHCDGLASSVIDCKLTPEVCDCVENE